MSDDATRTEDEREVVRSMRLAHEASLPMQKFTFIRESAVALGIAATRSGRGWEPADVTKVAAELWDLAFETCADDFEGLR